MQNVMELGVERFWKYKKQLVMAIGAVQMSTCVAPFYAKCYEVRFSAGLRPVFL